MPEYTHRRRRDRAALHDECAVPMENRDDSDTTRAQMDTLGCGPAAYAALRPVAHCIDRPDESAHDTRAYYDLYACLPA